MFRFEAKYDCLKRHAVALQFIGYQFLRVFFAASGGRKRASWQGDRNVVEGGGVWQYNLLTDDLRRDHWWATTADVNGSCRLSEGQRIVPKSTPRYDLHELMRSGREWDVSGKISPLNRFLTQLVGVIIPIPIPIPIPISISIPPTNFPPRDTHFMPAACDDVLIRYDAGNGSGVWKCDWDWDWLIVLWRMCTTHRDHKSY